MSDIHCVEVEGRVSGGNGLYRGESGMSDIEVRNAMITFVQITNGDHGCLTVFLSLDFGGSGQGFGGHMLFVKGRKGDNTGLFLWRCLEIAGVTEVDRLVGRAIRVRYKNDRDIEAIGHLLNDDWFYPSKELAWD